MTARQGADPRDKLTRLSEVLRREDWARGKDFYLDGFTDLTPQERQVVDVLLGKCSSLTVALTCDKLEEDQGGAGIFSPARRTARQLLRLTKDRGVPAQVAVREKTQGVRTPPLAHLERELFSPQPRPFLEEAEGLGLFTACTPYSEVEWAAAEMLRLVREEGYRFRDIAVCARSMEGYGSLIETVFARYGVPVFLSRMSDILEKPILALITAALDTAAGGYRYDDVFRYLKTGLTDLSQEDVDLLENYALTWNLEGSAWTGSKPWTNHPKGYGRTFTPEDKALVERLEGLRRQVAGPLETLRKNPDRTGAGQAKALYKLLEDIGVPQRLAERAQALRADGQEALAEEYAQLWDILCGGPGAVRSDSGGEPHGAGGICPAVRPGALSVRCGLHPGVPGPGDLRRDAPVGPQAVPGGLSAGGGRRGHSGGGPLSRPAQRRRPEPVGLLWPGAGPPAGGQAVPGDDHCI